MAMRAQKKEPRRSPEPPRRIERTAANNVRELRYAVLQYIQTDSDTNLNSLTNFDAQVALLDLSQLDQTKLSIPHVTVSSGRAKPGFKTWCEANINYLLPEFDISGLTPEAIVNAYMNSLKSLEAAKLRFTAGLGETGKSANFINTKIERLEEVIKQYFSHYTKIGDDILNQEKQRILELHDNAVEKERRRDVVVAELNRLLPEKNLDFVIHRSGVAISMDTDVHKILWSSDIVLLESIKAYAETLPEGGSIRIIYKVANNKKTPEQRTGKISEKDKLTKPLTAKLEQVVSIARVFQVTGKATRDQLDQSRRTTEEELRTQQELQRTAEEKVVASEKTIQSLSERIDQLTRENEERDQTANESNLAILDLKSQLDQAQDDLRVLIAEKDAKEAHIDELNNKITGLIRELDAALLREEQLRVLLSEVGHGDFDAGMQELVLALQSFDPETTPSPEERQKLEAAVNKILGAITKKTDAQVPAATRLPPELTLPTSGPVMIADVLTSLFATVVIYNGFRHYGHMSESMIMAIISYVIASGIHQGIAKPVLEKAAGKNNWSFNPGYALLALLATGEVMSGSQMIMEDSRAVVEAGELQTGVGELETQLTQELTQIDSDIELLKQRAITDKKRALEAEKVRGVKPEALKINPELGVGPKYKALEFYFDPRTAIGADPRDTRRRDAAAAMRKQVGFPENSTLDDWLNSQQEEIRNLTAEAQTTMTTLKNTAAKSSGISLGGLKYQQILRTFFGDERASAITGVKAINTAEVDRAFTDLITKLTEIQTAIAQLQYNIHSVQNGFDALKQEFADDNKHDIAQSENTPVTLSATTAAKELNQLEVTINEAVDDIIFTDNGTTNSLLILSGYAVGTEGLGLLVAYFATLGRRIYFSGKRKKISDFETKLAIAQNVIVDKLTPAVKAIFDNLIDQTGDSSTSLNAAFVREWLTTRLGQAAVENHGQVPNHYIVTQKLDSPKKIVAVISDEIGTISQTVWTVGGNAVSRLAGTHAYHSEPEERIRYEAEFMKSINHSLREGADLIDTANALHAIHPTLGELFVGMINQYDPANGDLPETKRKLGQRVDVHDMLADMTRYVSLRAAYLQTKLATTKASVEVVPFSLNDAENPDSKERRFTDAQVDAMRIHYRLSEMLAQTLSLMEALANNGYLPPASPGHNDENLKADLSRSLDRTVDEVQNELSEEEKASIHTLVNELGKKMAGLCSNTANNLPEGTSLQTTVAPGTQGLNLRVNLVRDNHILATTLCHEPLPAHTQKRENREKYLLGVETWFQTNGLARLIGTEKHAQQQAKLTEKLSEFSTKITLTASQELPQQIADLLSEQTLVQRQKTALADPKMTLADFTRAENQNIANEREVYRQAINMLTQLKERSKDKITFVLDVTTQIIAAYPMTTAAQLKRRVGVGGVAIASIQLTDCLVTDEYREFQETVTQAV